MVADGGFDKQRDSEKQEEEAFRLVKAEVRASVKLLKEGGEVHL